ncbi:pyridoxamine 5'-phosphate oxidase family protein [Streptacidiphilus sp. N1-10]|uniref:Pyridoxamine 5'-phosphate oxidase family protein n=1 Tax=Streptacidiphilus jeojiensis TaxID=3229225 RepID=A0ABV6XN92_9ACTN
MVEQPRPLVERKRDALEHLASDKDLWIASADGEGDPTLVPVSFWWDGESIFIATVRTNPTGLNIARNGRVRVALGHPRDVVLIEAAATLLESSQLPPNYGEAYAEKCGWDPRESPGYRFFRIDPERIESWRELNEHADREIFRDGGWVV